MPSSRRTPRPRPRAAQLLAIIVLFGAGACGGGAGIGEHCDSLSECASHLQCVNHICVPRCDRHADCGDGHVCREDGICEVVVSEIDDYCEREIECGPGQYCRLDDTDPEQDGVLAGSCQEEQSGGVLDAACTGATQEEADAQCRQGTCALGRCVYMCITADDCPIEHVCSTIPRQLAPLPAVVPAFSGCLPDRGDIVYEIPTDEPFEASIMLPVPGAARSFALVMSVEDQDTLVGAVFLRAPNGEELYEDPTTREEFFANPVRHDPAPGIATLVMPQRPAPFDKGAYFVDIASFGQDVPTVEVIYKLDDARHLDLHFYFLDLSTHPCPLMAGIRNAGDAQVSTDFQDEFLDELSLIFARADIVLDRSEATYTDITGRGDLDGLDASRLEDLLALSSHEGGVHVFFVRSISPAGLEGLVGGPPVPPGRPGTRASGVAIATDTLCYADWKYLARTTAHEMARGLGLQRSVEPDGYEDQIDDSGYETTNLMYFSDHGAFGLSEGQEAILRLSPELH